MDEQTFSLEALSEFIGREAILGQVHGWLTDGQIHLAFIEGEYGIGKTRTLHRILHLAGKEIKYAGAPTHLIDLYHFRQHSPEGLARAIFASFKDTENEHYFHPFITERRRLEAARAAGDGTGIQQHLEKMLAACHDALKKISAEGGVLLLFDTAEQFVYPSGARFFAPAWHWLMGWLRDLPRGVVLFAGRPSAAPLFQDLPIATLTLDFFTLEESRAYLIAVAKHWLQQTNQTITFSDEDIHRLHALSQGRPILLALFLELRMRNPQVFSELSGIQPRDFEPAIINYLLSLPKLGETLKAAGRTHKGMNAELLMKICGFSLSEAKAALETLKSMSFAKSFPEDERVYLHDEMYGLLEKYVYSAEGDAADGQTAAQAIYKYYKDAMQQKDQELKNVFASLTQEATLDQFAEVEQYTAKIRQLEASRQQLKTEFVYYRLRRQVGQEGKRNWFEDDPIFGGLKMYYRYGHEAAISNNDEILLHLQIELTNFWLGLPEKNEWKPFIEGLLTLHEIWFKVATAQSYTEEDIPAQVQRLAAISWRRSEHHVLLRALLNIWHGTGLVFAKDPQYDQAETLFTQVLKEVQNLSVDPRLEWFKQVIISLAHRQRAYLRRIRGAFQDAINDFQAALRYSRFIDFYHEEATLRNDLGFAQMLAGMFLSAFENLWDGLQLRYTVAIGHRIALSYSSLAQYFIATGAYEAADKHAEYALRIAGAVGFRRGLGLGSLAQAEAKRRLAFSPQGQGAQQVYLKQAQDAIEKALVWFEQMGEKARIIEAKLEQACLYRDRVRAQEDVASHRAWFEKSDKLFLETAQDAEKTKIEYRLVDAMCNRVWLGYFAQDMDHAEQAAGEFELLEVLKPYWLKNGKFVDEAQARKNPQLWSQIGKYYVARGMIALKKWEAAKKDEHLRNAAHFMMLGLTYDTKFAEDHRGLREGRRTIYQTLTPLNPQELQRFSGYVLEAEKEENISAPSKLQLLMQDHALWFG